MVRLLGFVVLCLLVVGGIGLYRGWFTVSTSTSDKNNPDLHLTIDKPRLKDDMHTVGEEVHSVFGEKASKETK